MIPLRQQPRAKRVIRSGYDDQVPGVIAAQIATLTAQAEREASELVVDKILRTIKDGISVEHLPNRTAFEAAFLSKRATPVQVKIDSESEGVYLVGVGLPGREELVLNRVPVEDETGQVCGHELITTNEIHYDTVITYCQVSWQEYRDADEAVSLFDPHVVAGIGSYFDIPAHKEHAVAIRLATPGLDDDDLHRIAMHALQNQGAAASTHSMGGGGLGLAY
jgi:hypothetical protein